MNIKSVFLGLPVFLFLASPGISLAANTGDSYAGIQYAAVTYSEDGFADVNPAAVVGKYGYYFNDFIAVEGRLGFGISDDSINISGIPVTLKIDSLVGMYAIASLPLSNAASVYGLLGFTRAELTASALGLSVGGSETDFSYGAGAEFSFGNNTSASIEYMSYLTESDFDVNAISIGINFAF